MSDTDNQLDTNDEEIESQEETQEEEKLSMRDELAMQLEAMSQESEEEDDGEEESEEDGEEESEETFESRIEEDLKSFFKLLKKEERQALEEKDYPPELVNMFLKDMKEKNDAYQEKTRDFSDIVKTIEPYEKALAMQGMTPAEKIRQYIAIESDIQSDPVNGILRLAQSYGVDLAEALKKEQSNEGFVDPALKEISELRKQLDELKNSKVNEERQTLQEQVDQFRSATNEDGTAKYPYFDKVRTLMAVKFKEGEADTLEKAYDLVVKDLGISNKVVQPTPQRKSVKQAKHLGAGVRSKSTAEKIVSESKDRKEEMKEIWNSLNKSQKRMA